MPETSKARKSTTLQHQELAPSNTFEALIERAFAPISTPDSTPRLNPSEARKSFASVSTIMPSAPDGGGPDESESKLLDIWERVREAKAKRLEMQPSKVKSLENLRPMQPRLEAVREDLNKALTRRKSTVNFKESSDSQTVTATFEMGGVKKQDMHVSFKLNRIVVTWRRTRVVEKMEGSVKVRERQEKQYNQIIPVPEGTKFADIRATRDGRRLTLTYPNFKGAAAVATAFKEPEEPDSPHAAIFGAPEDSDTEFFSCLPD